MTTVSLFIGVITILHIIGYIIFVRSSARAKVRTVQEGDLMGHVWDGDLQETNNPLPGWWVKLFYLMIIVGIIVLITYPGVLGKQYKGLLGWSQVDQYEKQELQDNARAAEYFSVYKQKTVEELAQMPEAIAAGRRIFLNNCAVCHGSNAQGAALGYPNLTDDDWIWGKDPGILIQTITNGRNTIPGQGMPAGGALPNTEEDTLTAVASYVQKLGGKKDIDPVLAEKGKALFDQSCIACHGPEGKGNQALGAPNIADNTWLYSADGNISAIKAQILHPVNNMMPAWKDSLSEERIKVVAAYVYSLSSKNNKK